MIFGNRVRSQREYLQFSQREFAHKIGKTQAYVSLVETGNYYPNSDIREKMSEVLNVSVKYLLGEESQVPIAKPTDDLDENHHALGYLSFAGAEDMPQCDSDAVALKAAQLRLKAKQSEDEIPDIEKFNNPVLKRKLLQDFAEESPKNDEIPDDPDCKKVLELVQKNLDHLFKITGDQFFISPKTSLYSLSEIAKHYKISPSYLFEDHEKEWLKEEIENKYKEIEQMEAKLATLEKND